MQLLTWPRWLPGGQTSKENGDSIIGLQKILGKGASNTTALGQQYKIQKKEENTSKDT